MIKIWGEINKQKFFMKGINKMKTNTISKAKRATNFALGLSIALTSLISQAYSSNSNEDYFYNQGEFYGTTKVQMTPIKPIIEAVNQAKVEIKNKIEFESSSMSNISKESSSEIFRIQERVSRMEDHIILLEQHNAEIKQQNIELKQKLEIQIQQNLKLEQKMDQQNMQANAFLEKLLQKFK